MSKLRVIFFLTTGRFDVKPGTIFLKLGNFKVNFSLGYFLICYDEIYDK